MFKLDIKLFVLAYLACFSLKAQNEIDVVRYSMQTIGSTARSYGVAGAFGAIGADASCAGINPSGLARFRNSSINLSAGFYNAKNNATYIGQTFNDNKFNFNIPNLGLIVNLPAADYTNKKPTGFVNFVFGFNVNRLNNYNMRSIFSANNKESSITQDWAARANSTNDIPSNFSKYSLEHLAYQTWLLDKDTSSPTPAYLSAYGRNPAINVNQQGNILTKGALNDYNASFAGNYRHILLFGISLGAKSVRYIQSNSFKEKDNKAVVKNSEDIDYVILDQYQRTNGVGLNAKFGVNLAPNEYVRIGYAYHSPTIYNLTDSYSYTITSKFDYQARDQFGDLRNSSTATTDATVYKYKISVPGRQVFSLGLVNKNLGFLSLDIESVNYSQSYLYAKDYAFTDENLNLKKSMNPSVINLRLGGELIQEQFRLRAGYARYPSTYREGAVPYVKSLVNNIYTLGLGIKEKRYSFDVAYVNSGYANYFVPYTLPNGISYAITNNVRSSNLIISASFLID